MKKLIPMLVLAAGAFADLPLQTNSVNSNHRIYIKPDFAVNTDSAEKAKINEMGRYYGFDVGYEYSKPNNIYAAIESSVMASGMDVSLYDDNNAAGVVYKQSAAKTNVEGKLGALFTFKNISLAPFTGTGAYFLKNGGSYDNLLYIPIGAKAEYQYKQLTVALKGEQLWHLHSWNNYLGIKDSESIWKNYDTGYEVAVSVGYQGKKLGASLEPYYLKVIDNVSFAGLRASTTYSF